MELLHLGMVRSSQFEMLQCTACTKQIHPQDRRRLCMHPILKVLVCRVSFITCVNISITCSYVHTYSTQISPVSRMIDDKIEVLWLYSEYEIQAEIGTWSREGRNCDCLYSSRCITMNFLLVYSISFHCLIQKCYQWYNSGTFRKDENGIDEDCRWCGEGGQLLCCDYCTNAFCKPCIKRNLGRTALYNLLNSGEHLFVIYTQPTRDYPPPSGRWRIINEVVNREQLYYGNSIQWF